MIRLMTFLLASLTTLVSWSGSAADQPVHFSVRLLTTRAAEKCTSEALGRAATAVVQVVCNSGNFVRIDPAPGRAFVGSSQGTFRYMVGSGGNPGEFATIATEYGGNSSTAAVATVAGFSIAGNSTTDNQFELLISF